MTLTITQDEMTRRKARIEQDIAKWIAKAESLYGQPLAHKYNGIKRWYTQGQAAGLAYSSGHLAFHLGFVQDEWADMIGDTVPHEVAHLVDKWVFGGFGHGPSWKRVMRDFGLAPNRYHDKRETARKYKRKMTRYVYKCNCKDWFLSGQRHKKAVSYQACGLNAYRCPKCKSHLHFMERTVKK